MPCEAARFEFLVQIFLFHFEVLSSCVRFCFSFPTFVIFPHSTVFHLFICPIYSDLCFSFTCCHFIGSLHVCPVFLFSFPVSFILCSQSRCAPCVPRPSLVCISCIVFVILFILFIIILYYYILLNECVFLIEKMFWLFSQLA